MERKRLRIKPAEDWKDKYVRLAAEFENYKKRLEKERAETYANATVLTIEALLPVLDSMNSAKKMEVQGIEPLLQQFNDALTKLGVEEIAVDGEFNPALHNAVMHEEKEDAPVNSIAEEFAKGYKLGEKIIRHSLVKVYN